MESEQEQVLIQGPTGDLIQIGRDDFAASHYAEQGYEIVGPVPVDEPEAPADEAE